jgi:hypothetical protein
MDKAEFVAECLDALGAAYRNDWSDFDGRQLRGELGTLSSYLRGSSPTPTFEEWLEIESINETKHGYEWK